MGNSAFTSSNNNWTYQRLEHPTLDLDVYITEDHVEKMFVYKDDSPKHLADEFSKKFNLSKEKRDVLIQVIKNQVIYINLRLVFDQMIFNSIYLYLKSKFKSLSTIV